MAYIFSPPISFLAARPPQPFLRRSEFRRSEFRRSEFRRSEFRRSEFRRSEFRRTELRRATIVAGILLLGMSTHARRATAVGDAPISVTASSPREVTETRVGARVVLAARPDDSNFAVTAVRFLLDGNVLAEVGPPGRFVWNTRGLRAGRHMLQVQAFSDDRFVGLSFPTALWIVPPAGDGAPAVSPSSAPLQSVVELSFNTYEVDARRASSVLAPHLKNVSPTGDNMENAGGGEFIQPSSGLGPDAATRSANLIVEVYLNGVRQDFAPAARLACADDLEPLETSDQAASAQAASTQAASAPRHSVPQSTSRSVSSRVSSRRRSASRRRSERRRSERRGAARRYASRNDKKQKSKTASNASLRGATAQNATAKGASGVAVARGGSDVAADSDVVRTVWMPARPLLERLGARLRWDAASRTLIAELDMAGGMRRITLAPDAGRPGQGAAFADIGGQHLQLQMPVRQTENTLMVPLAFCTQALNLRAAWQKETRRLELFTPIAPA